MLTQERGPACARPRSLRYLQSFDERGYLLLVVLAIVIILAGVFAFVRARNETTPSRTLAIIITTAFILAVITELLGRGMHYEGLWHIGLNTTQTLLRH